MIVELAALFGSVRNARCSETHNQIHFSRVRLSILCRETPWGEGCFLIALGWVTGKGANYAKCPHFSFRVAQFIRRGRDLIATGVSYFETAKGNSGTVVADSSAVGSARM